MPAKNASKSEKMYANSTPLEPQLRVDPPHEVTGGVENVATAAKVKSIRLNDVSTRLQDVAILEHASIGDEVAATVPTRPAVSARSPDNAMADGAPGESVNLQIEQLAERLSAQLRDVDRREAGLHAQLAEQENATRSARHWLRERQHELNQRDADLNHREEAIRLKQAELARDDQQHAEGRERTKSDQRRLAEATASRQREFETREQAIAAREASLAAATAALAEATAEQKLELEVELSKLLQRQQNLDEAEALLVDSQTGLEQQQRQLAADRQAWHERSQYERRQIQAEQAKNAYELEQKARLLTTRTELLDRRAAAFEQLREEVATAHRETLDLRLATDELWAELCGENPPAELAKSLARIRGQIAATAREQRRENAAARQEVETSVGRLAEDRQHLQRQADEMESWTATCRDEFSAQAERLAQREHSLDLRQMQLDELVQRLQEDRQAYEREIRRLLGQLRATDCETVVSS